MVVSLFSRTQLFIFKPRFLTMTFKEFVEQNIVALENKHYAELFDDATKRGFGLRFRELLEEIDSNWLEELTYIPSHVFGYSSLDTFVVPENITAISEYAFMQSSIKVFDASQSKISHIRTKAFAYCEELVEVRFPKTLRYIASLTFRACDDLHHITYPGTLREWDINVIKDAGWKDDDVRILVHCTDGEVYV